MARQFSTVIEFIQYGKVNSNTFGAGVIEFEGFNSIGDGGATLWQREGTTGLTPSKTPTEFDDNRFTDAVGDLWVLVPSQIITFNGVQFLPLPFGGAGNGGYYFNGTEFVFLASAADEAAAAAASAAAAQVSAQRAEDAAASIEGQLTTTQLIASSLTLDVGDTIQTNGFTTAGDGGGAQWLLTSNTNTPSQSPSELGATSEGCARLSDSQGRVWLLSDKHTIKPTAVGAIAGGVNSSNELTLCFNMLRNKINSGGFSVASVTIDGGNNTFYVTESIDATKIRGWNYNVQNLSLYGKCTGQSVLDLTGSRGGKASNISIYGDVNLMPTTGIQFARSSESGFGFCDNWMLENVSTFGYFSVAGGYFYAQETTHYDHCRFWNYNNEARAAIHVGNDSLEPYSSLYATPVTGSHSFINNKYTNVDYRYLPSGKSSIISNISNSDPAVVTTSTNHSFETGDLASFIQVKGMEDIDNRSLSITKISDTSFSVDGVDSTSYGAFESGSAIKSQSKSTVLLARCEQHTFDTSYIVAYGAPHLEIAFIDGNPIDQLKLDFLFEGGGMGSHVRFTGVDSFESTVNGFELETYNTHSSFALISSDALTGMANLKGGFIKINSEAKASLSVLASPSKFNLYSIDVEIPDSSKFDLDLIGFYSGAVKDQSGKSAYYGSEIVGEELTEYTPTLTSQNGSVAEYTVVSYKYREIGGVLTFSTTINIVDIGTASGPISISNPKASTATSVNAGRENATTGNMLQAVTSGQNTSVRFFDNSVGFSSGNQLILSGSYLT